MRIRPLGDNVIVQDEEVNIKTLGGVLLPPDVRTSSHATVIAVGPGRVLENGRRNPMPVKAGDIVLVAKGGTPCQYDDLKRCRIVDIQDIIATKK